MGKGRKERVVYLHRAGYQLVERYLRERPGYVPDEPLFRNRFGEPITISGVQDRIQHYAKLSGVTVTCHHLRHTYGRWMAESEMPVLTLSRLLGHQSTQTTQRYIDGADPEVRRSYEAAMKRSLWADKEILTTPEATPSEVVATGVTTVRRTVPAAFDSDDWMPDWPAWLREGCLNWIRHQWYHWKPTRRQQHARRY